MRLTKYLVTDFRSVKDSGWIETDRVTAFIGVNESGKTNLLIPLWKLNPAREGEILPTSDYPKKMFGEIREAPGKYKFITAEFDCSNIADEISELTEENLENFKRVHVSRRFDASYEIHFPDHNPARNISTEELKSAISATIQDIEGSECLESEQATKSAIIAALNRWLSSLQGDTQIGTVLKIFQTQFTKLLPGEPEKTSTIVPRFAQFINFLDKKHAVLTRPSAGMLDEVKGAVLKALPKFVYYSNYGNLDSEIYLPHVVQNMERGDLGSKEAAKVRTLKVLFNFVRLAPKEILELGQDFKDPANPNRVPNPDEVAKIGEKKRERSILLQSASSSLTQRFREWWKQGDYRFRFEADGNHFRIWVADDRRPEEIELESRSTGLQWFLSFYLVFLVESEGEHENAILLLDEPGLSLHPLAQRDLSAFFEGLTKTNQILYTTHSPFLVDADHLDRARKVFVAPDGTTKATENLRETGGDAAHAGAAYAVYSALNLNVAESLLLGCQPTIVEGPSDQHYLTGVKTILIRAGKITPKRELIFPPSGGAKTARTVASILTGRDDVLPYVLLDDDEMGRKMAQQMKDSLYQDAKDRVLNVATFAGIKEAEIEDLFPTDFISAIVDRWQRVPEPDDEFSAIAVRGKPIVPQIEQWAEKRNIGLDHSWKVDLAKRAKQALLSKGIEGFDADTIAKWESLFSAIM